MTFKVFRIDLRALKEDLKDDLENRKRCLLNNLIDHWILKHQATIERFEALESELNKTPNSIEEIEALKTAITNLHVELDHHTIGIDENNQVCL